MKIDLLEYTHGSWGRQPVNARGYICRRFACNLE